jgi:hypothetical protein
VKNNNNKIDTLQHARQFVRLKLNGAHAKEDNSTRQLLFLLLHIERFSYFSEFILVRLTKKHLNNNKYLTAEEY